MIIYAHFVVPLSVAVALPSNFHLSNNRIIEFSIAVYIIHGVFEGPNRECMSTPEAVFTGGE